MEEAESTWSALLSRLPLVRDFVDDCDGLAARVVGLADRLDRFVEGNAATLIHGDCKAWNLFFGQDRALFIDLQWVGRGHPMQVKLPPVTFYRAFIFSIVWTSGRRLQPHHVAGERPPRQHGRVRRLLLRAAEGEADFAKPDPAAGLIQVTL